jgi:hypothetical protein
MAFVIGFSNVTDSIHRKALILLWTPARALSPKFAQQPLRAIRIGKTIIGAAGSLPTIDDRSAVGDFNAHVGSLESDRPSGTPNK